MTLAVQIVITMSEALAGDPTRHQQLLSPQSNFWRTSLPNK